eukprot:gene17336-biopygen26266
MTTMSQTGGRELGSGLTAQTIEISNPSDATDTDTFQHILASTLANVKKTKSWRAWTIYALNNDTKKLARVKLATIADKEELFAAISNTKVSAKYVCKDLNTFSSLTAFKEEIRTAEMLFRNLNAPKLAKATTFSSIPFKRFKVVGLDLGGNSSVVNSSDRDRRDSGFYIFSLRCSMSAASKGISSDANMDKFVRETLENFDVIHRAGIIHGDVKLDNMIYCAKDDRYRLIDWGKTADHAEMVARYVDNTRFGFVNNTSSPMAWFCCGMNYAASLVFMTMIVTRHMQRVAMCPPMRALVAHAYTSFHLALRSSLDGNPLFKLDKVTDKKLRLAILDRYAQSFDLYDIGLILTAFVCMYEDALSARMRERSLALAFRLVDYGDPSAHLSTARDALRWWVHSSVAQNEIGRAIDAGKNTAKNIIVLDRSSTFLASAGEGAVPPVVFDGRKRARTRVSDDMGSKVTSVKTRPATNDNMIASHGTLFLFLVLLEVFDC